MHSWGYSIDWLRFHYSGWMGHVLRTPILNTPIRRSLLCLGDQPHNGYWVLPVEYWMSDRQNIRRVILCILIQLSTLDIPLTGSTQLQLEIWRHWGLPRDQYCWAHTLVYLLVSERGYKIHNFAPHSTGVYSSVKWRHQRAWQFSWSRDLAGACLFRRVKSRAVYNHLRLVIRINQKKEN